MQAPVSLLRRGALEIPPDASANKIQELKNAIPKQYIVNMIQNTPVASPGSKVFIIKSGTGSGKSTTLPTALAIRGRRIAVTEPQRLTAEEIPYDIASYDKNFKIGENIGFQTGLINKTPPRGVVFMTTGILMMQMLMWSNDKFIRRYSTIMIDEVHKHDMQTDVLLRLLKQFLAKNWTNPDCPVLVVMSATMDPKKYIDYFETKNYVGVDGISFPITAHWPESTPGDLTQAIVSCVRNLKGDTMVFLPTGKIISDVAKALRNDDPNGLILEVMSKTLHKGEVKQMLKPAAAGERRVVLATNAAETGLTLKYLQNVIDTGLVFRVDYNPQYASTTMSQSVVARSSALQRKGRVGRKFPGDWYPLFTEETFNAMIASNPPEIYVSDLSQYLLNLIVALTETKFNDQNELESLLEFDPATLGLIHDPSAESLQMAYEKLYQLGLIHQNWLPTMSGFLASKIKKITPELAKMLLSAAYHHCDMYKLVVIAACVSIGQLGRFDGFGKIELQMDRIQCDFIKLLLVYELLQRQIKRQIVKHLSTNWIREWCEEKGMVYDSWLTVIEMVYELTFTLMQLGFKIDMASEPLIDTFDQDLDGAMDEVLKIKKCIYEGFRLNTASWNSRLMSYVTNFKHSKLVLSHELDDEPMNIITEQILYRKNNFTSGDLISILDNFIILDNHFMY
jgi:HrpA-like RNA helicase